MTADTLKSYTLKDLAELAKNKGVSGWHAMRKDQLVKAIVKSVQRSSSAKPTARRATAAKSKSRAAASAASSGRGGASRPVASRRSAGHRVAAAKKQGHPQQAKSSAAKPSRIKLRANKREAVKALANKNGASHARKKTAGVTKRLEQARSRHDRAKNLAAYVSPASPNGFTRDRLVVLVRDPFWLHAYWELTRQGVERAQAAMNQDWHSSRPVLRLVEVFNAGATSSTEALVRNIDIHGGVNNWYIDVSDPPKSYRLDIGYLAANGKFFLLARSNIVSTPRAGASDSIDENWTDVAQNFDKIYAMSGGYAENGSNGELTELFEERLRRPMGAPIASRMAGLNGFEKKRDFTFEVDAELIVFGATEPTARVTLQGDPVRLRPDGTFTVRFSLPNCRQVIPAVASSADGLEQRTIVLAVERNTKTMEPVVRDGSE